MGAEAQFLRKLFSKAADIVSQQLKTFDPQELRLYSKTLTKFSEQLSETTTDITTKAAFLQSLRRDLQTARKASNGIPGSVFLERIHKITLTAFGSTVMGTGLRSGDLDISLSGTYNYRSFSKQLTLNSTLQKSKLHGTLLKDLLHFLKANGRIMPSTKSIVLSRASVPLLKFTDRKYGLKCDVSIGNESGVIRSRILGEIIKSDKTIQTLIPLLKKWTRVHHLNDASTGSFGSYVLSTMAIAFCTERGVLPPSRVFAPYMSIPHLSDLDLHCSTLAKEMQQAIAQRQEKEVGILETFLSMLTFLALYWTRETIYSGMSPRIGICCRDGLVVDHAYLASKGGAIVVRDPFELHSSCSKPVRREQLQEATRLVQLHMTDMMMFLSGPPEHRRENWRTLFKSLFKIDIRFKNTEEAKESVVNADRDRNEEKWREICCELIDHFAEREGDGLPAIPPGVFNSWFVVQVLEKTKHCQSWSNTAKSKSMVESRSSSSSSSLFDIAQQSIAVPVQ